MPGSARGPTRLPSAAGPAPSVHVPAGLPGMSAGRGMVTVMRPAIKPGLLVVWRDRDTLQIGIDPRRAVALTGMGRPAALIGLLDGSREHSQVLAAARAAGHPARAGRPGDRPARGGGRGAGLPGGGAARAAGRAARPGWPASWPRRRWRTATPTAGPGSWPAAGCLGPGVRHGPGRVGDGQPADRVRGRPGGVSCRAQPAAAQLATARPRSGPRPPAGQRIPGAAPGSTPERRQPHAAPRRGSPGRLARGRIWPY